MENKTIDIIGVYSKADLITDGKVPVLYKIIESALKYNFNIKKICLYNSFDSNEMFFDDFSIILNTLKNNYINYDFKDIDLLNVHCINNIEDISNYESGIILFQGYKTNNQIKISDYYSFFNKATNSSRSDCIYFNLQSGNVQSREAIQICCQYYSSKENYIYFESFNNKKLEHSVDKECVQMCHNLADIEDIAKIEGYDKLINRINIDNDIYKVMETFHNNIISNFIENKKYFEMYYHYLNYKTIFNDKIYTILDNCFNNSIRLKHLLCNESNIFEEKEVYRIEKKEVAKYFLFRLFYIKFKIEENYFDRKLFDNIEELIYLLYHLEVCDYVDRKEDYFLVSSKKISNDDSFVECLMGYFYDKKTNLSNGNNINGIKISNLDQNLIRKFNEIFKPQRHDLNENNDYKSIKKIFTQLITKFDNEYVISFKNDIYSKFNYCYDILIESLKNNLFVDNNKVNKILTSKLSSNVCFLSMAGSTDPINKRNEKDFYFGSFLTFKYGIEYLDKTFQDNKNSIMTQLYNINKMKNIPSYFIFTKEMIEELLDENKNEYCLKIEEMNKLYKGDIKIVPFVKSSSNESLNYNSIINDNYSVALDSLLEYKSYSEEGYTLDKCTSFAKNIVNILLEKYDSIVVVESSGIPSMKMALTFMTLMYPTKIIPYMIKNPNSNDSMIKNYSNSNIIDLSNHKQIFEPIKSEHTILSNISQTNEDYNNLISYLLQNIKYDANSSFFKSSNLANYIENIKSHDKNEIFEDESTIHTNECTNIARIMCKSLYLSKFGYNSYSLECLDKVFEIVFGKRLRNRINNENIKINQDNLNKNLQIKRIFERYSGLKSNGSNGKSSNNMINGVINAIIYASNKKNFVNKINWISSTWKNISSLKHTGKFKKEQIISEEDLNIIASFDIEIAIKFEKEKKYYKNILNQFPYLFNKNK